MEKPAEWTDEARIDVAVAILDNASKAPTLYAARHYVLTAMLVLTMPVEFLDKNWRNVAEDATPIMAT